MTAVRRDGARPGQSMPLRVRLTAVLVLLVTLGLAAAAAASTSALKGYLVGRVDDQLTAEASQRRCGGEGGPGRGRERGAPPGRFYVAVLDRSGALLRECSSPTDDDGSTPVLDGVRSDGLPRTVASSDGRGEWRVVAADYGRPGQPLAASIVVASDLDDVAGTTRRLLALQLGIGLAVLALVGGIGFLLVQRSLRPLVEVEEAAAAVAAGDLTRRVPSRDPRTEVGSLSRSFNEMVEQVQTAFATQVATEERLRRFAADASHELRTPLTSIRGFAELYRQGAATSEPDIARLMSRIEDESVRMASLVEDLLQLARLDQQRPLEREPVDLLQLATDAVHDAGPVSGGRSVALHVVGEQAPVVVGDEGRLRQVLANLVTNALTYTPATATVTVRVGTAGSSAFLEVADDGPGMTTADAARVFERFYRVDASRTRGEGSGGSGLGLSIVQAIVAAHGGTVDLVTAPGEGASFRVRLPLT